MKYRYSLEKGSKKFRCPVCNQNKKYVRYIDNQTAKYLPYPVGRCERINKCGYHLKPKEYFRLNPSINVFNSFNSDYIPECVKEPRPHLLSPTLKKNSMKHFKQNHFTLWLIQLFGTSLTNELIEKYKIGTSKRWQGANIFWQIDADFRPRSGKVMLYNHHTGKRIKSDGKSYIDWVHSILMRQKKLENFELRQCLFGEHLLSMEKTGKPVAIVESEKTAITMSVVFPRFTWMACGSVHNLNERIIEILKERTIVLYPDLNAFELWAGKAYELKSKGFDVMISSLLEDRATNKDRAEGLDLADYFLKLDQRGIALTDEGYPLAWKH